MASSIEKALSRGPTSNPGPRIRNHRLGLITGSFLSALLSTHALTHEVLAGPVAEARNYESVEKIAAIESGLQGFAARVLPNLDRHVRDPSIKEKIRRAFQIGLPNAASDNKLATGGEVLFGMEDGFTYNFHSRSDVTTLFNGLTRTLSLPRDFDPTDIGDMTFLLHELMHADEDDVVRKTVSWKTYTAYWRSAGEKPLCIIESETAIIGAELEALNAALGGALKSKKSRIPSRRPEFKRTLTNSADRYRTGTLEHAIEASCRKYAVVFGPDLIRR